MKTPELPLIDSNGWTDIVETPTQMEEFEPGYIVWRDEHPFGDWSEVSTSAKKSWAAKEKRIISAHLATVSGPSDEEIHQWGAKWVTDGKLAIPKLRALFATHHAAEIAAKDAEAVKEQLRLRGIIGDLARERDDARKLLARRVEASRLDEASEEIATLRQKLAHLDPPGIILSHSSIDLGTGEIVEHAPSPAAGEVRSKFSCYCCGHDPVNGGDAIHRINVGELPSRWLCTTCKEGPHKTQTSQEEKVLAAIMA